MKCYYCEREIGKGEKFYEIEEQHYCNDCIKERTITLYNIGEEEADPWTEDDVLEFDDKYEYLKHLHSLVEQKEARLRYYNRDKNTHSNIATQRIRNELEKVKDKIKKLEQEE